MEPMRTHYERQGSMAGRPSREAAGSHRDLWKDPKESQAGVSLCGFFC